MSVTSCFTISNSFPYSFHYYGNSLLLGLSKTQVYGFSVNSKISNLKQLFEVCSWFGYFDSSVLWLVWRILMHSEEKDNAITRAKIPFSSRVCRKSSLSFHSFFFLRAQFHRCLRPCWEGIKGPEDNNPAGKDSLEKNRRCASPSPWLHYHQAHKHHIQHRTTLYCFFPSCQHPRQLCQVRQVPQSTADRSMWLASPLEWLSQVGYLAALQMFERLVHKSYIYPEQLRDSIHPNFKRAVWQ